jgi:hypothetical protein
VRAAQEVTEAFIVVFASYHLGRIFSLSAFQSHLQASFHSLYIFFGPLSSAIGAFVFAHAAFGVLRLKQKCLLVYAHLQLLFAFITSYVAVDKARNNVSGVVLLTFCAAVYLFVGGLEDRKKAVEEERDRIRVSASSSSQ